MKFYNLSVIIRGQKCLVVGGGKVALRKVRKLCAAEANVIVVSPEVLPEFHKENIHIIQRKYTKEVLQDSLLVFAATSDFTINQQICEDAKEMGIWANSANGAEYGSFIIPATCKKDLLTLGITTEGKAPILSKEVRKYLQNKIANISSELIADIVALREQKVVEKDTEKRKELERKLEEKAEQVIQQMDRNE